MKVNENKCMNDNENKNENKYKDKNENRFEMNAVLKMDVGHHE